MKFNLILIKICIEYKFEYYFSYYPRNNALVPQHPGDRRLLEEYDLRVTIGNGNFGVVKMGIHKLSGKKVAVKCIDKIKLHQTSSTNRKTSDTDEFEIMKTINHPSIVRVYDCFEGSQSNYIIME